MKGIFALGLMAISAVNAQQYTRGIGVYPGDPGDFFGPHMRVDETTYRIWLEPLLALGLALVWAAYGGVYFMRSGKVKGRTTLVSTRARVESLSCGL